MIGELNLKNWKQYAKKKIETEHIYTPIGRNKITVQIFSEITTYVFSNQIIILCVPSISYDKSTFDIAAYTSN